VPNKIFVGGVPITVTEEQFKTCFAQHGTITKVELHALRGFGYITYDTVEAVDACLEKYEEHYLSKKWVEVKRSIPRELIDAYEREQRRLHSLSNDSSGGGTPSAPKAAAKEPAASPKAAPAASPVSGGKGGPPVAPVLAKATSAPPVRSPPAAAVLTRTRTSSSVSSAGGYGGQTPANLGRIAQLKEMGFSDEVAKRVLAECAWDVNKAIDRLLLSGVPDDMREEAGGETEEGVRSQEEPTPSQPADADPTGSQPAGGDANGKSSFFPVSEEEPAACQAEEERNGTCSTTPQNGGVQTQSQPEAAAATTSEVASSGTPAESAAEPVVAQPETTAPPAPAKRLERSKQAWTGGDASQLTVSDKEFVYVWTSTATDNGWIHAELAKDQSKVGWLPQIILDQLQEGQQWMRAKQKWEARDDTQCSVQVGEFCLVWVSSLTKEGWCYVDCQDSAGRGWLPDFCLTWNDPQ